MKLKILMIKNINKMYSLIKELPKELSIYYQKHYIKCMSNPIKNRNLYSILYKSQLSTIYDKHVQYIIYTKFIARFFPGREHFVYECLKKEPFSIIVFYNYFILQYRRKQWFSSREQYQLYRIFNAYNDYYYNYCTHTVNNYIEISAKMKHVFDNLINSNLTHIYKKVTRKQQKEAKKLFNYAANDKIASMFTDHYKHIKSNIIIDIEKEIVKNHTFSVIIESQRKYINNFQGFLHVESFITSIEYLNKKYPRKNIISNLDDLNLFIYFNKQYVIHTDTYLFYYNHINNVLQNSLEILESEKLLITPISIYHADKYSYINIGDTINNLIKEATIKQQISEQKRRNFDFDINQVHTVIMNPRNNLNLHEIKIRFEIKDKNTKAFYEQLNNFIEKLEDIIMTIRMQIDKNNGTTGILIINKKLLKLITIIRESSANDLFNFYVRLLEFLENIQQNVMFKLKNKVFSNKDNISKIYNKYYNTLILMNLKKEILCYKTSIFNEQYNITKNMSIQNLKDNLFAEYLKEALNIYPKKLNIISLLFEDETKTELFDLSLSDYEYFMRFFEINLSFIAKDSLLKRLVLDPTQGFLILYYYYCYDSIYTYKEIITKLRFILHTFKAYLKKKDINSQNIDFESLDGFKDFILRMISNKEIREKQLNNNTGISISDEDLNDINDTPFNKEKLNLYEKDDNLNNKLFKFIFTNSLLEKQKQNLMQTDWYILFDILNNRKIHYKNNIFIKQRNNFARQIYQVYPNVINFISDNKYFFYINKHNLYVKNFKLNLLSMLFSNTNIKNISMLTDEQLNLLFKFFEEILLPYTEVYHNFVFKLFLDITVGFGILKYYIYKTPYYGRISQQDMLDLQKIILNFQKKNNMKINIYLFRNIKKNDINFKL